MGGGAEASPTLGRRFEAWGIGGGWGGRRAGALGRGWGSWTCLGSYPPPPRRSGRPPPPGGAMYNGIGLPTPRGSGTNGYVQRNLSAVRHRRERAEDEGARAEPALLKRPNQDILDHERKRKVELKCLELAELMEEQG